MAEYQILHEVGECNLQQPKQLSEADQSKLSDQKNISKEDHSNGKASE